MKFFSNFIFQLFVTSLFLSSTGWAQWIQQGSKLLPDGAIGSTIYHGYSVALSADGNTAIVGSIGDNANAGAAWVYIRNGSGEWVFEAKLFGTGAIGNASQGFSVALSSDGNTAIVGGIADNTNAGAVWVFTRSGGVWNQQGNKLVGTGAVGNAQQGCAVSLSSDGNTAIVGGFRDNTFAGAVWAFTRNGNVWSQQGNKLVVTDAIGSSRLGISVDLTSDGNEAIVGGHTDNANAGAVWIFTRSDTSWTAQTKLIGLGAVGSSRFGRSVSISSDGNTALVGGIDDNAFAGATWVFTRSGGVWSQSGSKLIGSDAVGNANQGGAVAIAPDGNTAIVGGIADNTDIGAAWIFVPGTTSVQQSSNGMPISFLLEQNYPNPFNPTTKISWQSAVSSRQTLKIYDVLGNEIAILVNEEKPAGTYEIEFNAEGLTSGIYFYRLTGNNFNETRKMLLLK